MNHSSDPVKMPRTVLQKLEEVRSELRRVQLWHGLLWAAALSIGAVLIALVLDRVVVWFEPGWRWFMTLSVIGLSLGGFLYALVRPLLRYRRWESVAREIDRACPDQEERWSTLAELAESRDRAEVRGAESLIGKVAQETEALSDRVCPERVARRDGLRRARNVLVGAAAVFTLFCVLDLQRSGVLLQRLFLPWASISMTQVEAVTGNQIVPRHEPFQLEATISGKTPANALLQLRFEDGGAGAVPLTLAEGGTVAHQLQSVEGSFEYRVRAGDGQTPWHSITAVERPRIAEVRLRIVPPEYSRLPTVEEKALPHRVRALEGSRLSLAVRMDQETARVRWNGTDETDGTDGLVRVSEGWHEFSTELTQDLTITLTAYNDYLESLAKPTCRILVYQDQPPSVQVITPAEQVAVRPDEVLQIEFRATDDFGIVHAELVVVATDVSEEQSETVIPVPLDEQFGAREVHANVELDLAQFELEHGAQLSWFVRVTDTKALQGASEAALSEADEAALAEAGEGEQEGELRDGAMAAGEAGEAGQADGEPQDPPDAATQLAEASPEEQGAPMPPNPMSMRLLDVGQTSQCEPRHILIDEWVGSYDGQQREKQEIAINAVLERLAEALEEADVAVTNLLSAARLDQFDSESPAELEQAGTHLREANQAVNELRAKSSGTPYAFIGLQLLNIREAHISPARGRVAEVELEAAGEAVAPLEKGSFHIRRAREMLADLTRAYEAAQRDQRIAEALERIEQMHQVFLEDSHALLGSSPDVLNPYDRKMGEVDKEFAQKLQELLELRRDIMAELAKVLAEDPRLLRRFMAMNQTQTASLRDQFTLLNRRQEVHRQDVAQWLETAPEDRPALLARLRHRALLRQAEIASDAAQLYEAVITWLPLDMDPQMKEAAALQQRASDISRFSGEAVAHLSKEDVARAVAAAEQSLERLRELHGELGEFRKVAPTNAQLPIYVANRMTETALLVTGQSGWIRQLERIDKGEFSAAMEIDQHQLAVDTADINDKLRSVEANLSGFPEDIQSLARELNETIQLEIVDGQTAATESLREDKLEEASELHPGIAAGFEKGEGIFGRLMRGIIDILDEAPVPSEPGLPRSLEELLAMLEQERTALEALGIPCRPVNVSVLRDWMQPGSCSSGQQAAAMAEASQAQSESAWEEAQRLREALLRQGEAAEGATELAGAGPVRAPVSWNVLVSQLEEELRQGRGKLPPEQYRQATEQYFRILSEGLRRAEGVGE